jgi:hypothetical protein
MVVLIEDWVLNNGGLALLLKYGGCADGLLLKSRLLLLSWAQPAHWCQVPAA